MIVGQYRMRVHFAAVFAELCLHHRGRCIDNPAFVNLVAGGNQTVFFLLQRMQEKQGFIAGGFFGALHLFFFNQKRNDARARQYIVFFYGKTGRTRRNHHLAQCIHGMQTL